MKIKSLLLGSAAALAVVSGAQAADAIMAAQPEPVDYVKVCDAFGTGYFYIPGTETCLRIHGYVREDIGFGDLNGLATPDGTATPRTSVRASRSRPTRTRTPSSASCTPSPKCASSTTTRTPGT